MMLTACGSSKNNLTYFQTLEGQDAGILGPVGDYQLKIKPDDELVIAVSAEVPQAVARFNLPLGNPAYSAEITETTTPRQQTYVVDAKGDIKMAGIGRIHVAGLTTSELADLIDSKVSAEVKDATVLVQLVNFSVNVLGEVTNPRLVTANSERLSVLDAIAVCGDLTEYADRSKVMVIREQDGQKVFQRLDLRDAALTQSPFYYLQQNDVVYVEPNQIKYANSKYNTHNGYKLSVISTIVGSVSVIASLVIAFSR